MTRSHRPERLDDLDAAGPEHARVLDELGLLNRYLGTTRRAVRAVLEVTPEAPTIVDLGCGGGHLLAALREHLPGATLIGVDGNQAALAACTERVPGVHTVCADLCDPSFVAPDADVLVSSHFLYHLDDEAFVRFVERHRGAFVLVELRRTWWAPYLFGLLRPLLSSWTYRDGLVALERAFTAGRLRSLLPDWDHRVGLFDIVTVRSTSRGPTD